MLPFYATLCHPAQRSAVGDEPVHPPEPPFDPRWVRKTPLPPLFQGGTMSGGRRLRERAFFSYRESNLEAFAPWEGGDGGGGPGKTGALIEGRESSIDVV